MVKNRSIEILEKNKCSGCNACFSICPTKAINMEYDEEGFLYPIVTHNKCTNCGLCSKICPELNLEYNYNTKYPDKCYAMQANDEVRGISSSGGIFTLLANYVLDNRGYVCGAAFNDFFKVEHIIIDKKEDLYKLRYSKYVQSDKKYIFKQIKKLLNENKLVLFSGCHCEVAGLKTFLQKDYNNLLTVDIICHGVPSPKLWELYLKENYDLNSISSISFREKNICSWGLSMNICFRDKDAYRVLSDNDYYYKLFLYNVSLRNQCYNCSYRGFPKPGDITIGDFWGIEHYGQIYDGKGTTIYFINNNKGKDIIKKIEKDFQLLKDFPIDITNNMSNAIHHSHNMHPNRDDLFNNVYKLGFNNIAKYVLDDYADVGILNLCYQSNYGATLTSYAVYKIIKNLGYLPKIIAYIPQYLIGQKDFNFDKKFHKKYFNRTKIYSSLNELKELNNKIDSFIVGSDQIFRFNSDYRGNFYELHKLGLQNIYYLSFVDLDKKLISFAASFGVDYFEGDLYGKLLTKYHLSRFDNVSVREEDGQKLCKELFDIDADLVLEPVFLLDDEDWEEIISDSTLTHKGKLAYYILDPSPEKDEALKYISEKLNLETIDAGSNFHHETEDFLYIMKNADFIFTDSFHGVCFSCIFRKKFISFINFLRGASRFTLFYKLGLENRLIKTIDDLKNINLFEEINYDIMSNYINEYKDKSILWLYNALKKEKNKKITTEQAAIEYILNKYYELNQSNNDLQNRFDKLNQSNNDLQNRFDEVNQYYNNIKNIFDKLNSNINWIKLFGIYNTKESITIIFFGIKLIIKLNENQINKLAWWIPVRKWRDNFRDKFKI
ncbi:polysaccharide pyruvyl transferase family protein [Brachyspira murdochii]|uniref:polysaccharide pyruvyl transferase family protein n=1 Tax=Brachyspira murdochii TaxID=84378 RepID=UPI0018DFA426|nr:polysaccharide pyruvyl transferase family protein [Brachyspira murdochii]